MKCHFVTRRDDGTRRSPRGERGLKYLSITIMTRTARSLPSRGAWIEITGFCRGFSTGIGRSPRGERGLKFVQCLYLAAIGASLPSRGAWIEIAAFLCRRWHYSTSLPSRGAWIEMRDRYFYNGWYIPSLPSRGAWIEILPAWLIIALSDRRSPRGERGLKWEWIAALIDAIGVAPLAGSVD